MRSITHNDIKKMLSKKHLGHISQDDMTRELVVYETNHVSKSTMMMLSGSPPKGYCINNGRTLSLYDLEGRRFKILTDTKIVPDGGNDK